MELRLNNTWDDVLQPILEEPFMKDLALFIQAERTKAVVFPPKRFVFNALQQTDLLDVKIVILGQDPYHGEGQAHGLSFSVPIGVPFPPSLKNIFKELETDIPSFQYPFSGDLTSWAKQGVLLLNATLTVQSGQAGSHQKKGWEKFTDKIIEIISQQCDHVVFMLWGSYAQKKSSLIDASKHLILKEVHPSPLSVYRGFFGCKHFSKANQFLEQYGKLPIDWKLT